MTDQPTVTASIIGTELGGDFDDPFPMGRPSEGDRVALFAFEVRSVDGTPEAQRRYHVAPVGSAHEGPLGPARVNPQGDTVQWIGCGTATVVRVDASQCEVAPDEPGVV